MYSNLETVLSYLFTTRLHTIALNIFSNPIIIRAIIVAHVLFIGRTIIFSFLLDKANQEMIASVSWFHFEFDMENVLLQWIENRFEKDLANMTWINSLFDLKNGIINLWYFHKLRRTMSGFDQINIWWDWLSMEADAFKVFDYLLRQNIGLFNRKVTFNLILVHKF